jgi:hypothetical protein
MHLDCAENDAVGVRLEPPAVGADGAFRPTHLMERISQTVEREEGLSKNALRIKVPGNNEAKDTAVDILVAEGYVNRRRDGQAHRHYHLRPYREDADLAPSPEPRPNLAQARCADDLAHSPAPLKGRGAGRGEAIGPIEETDPAQVEMATAERDRVKAKGLLLP